jgi:hypothetical protein
MARYLKQDAWKNFAPNLGGQEWGIYSTVLDADVTFEDLFVPGFWKHHASGPRALVEGDIVRMRACDRTFDVDVTVEKVIPGGIVVSLRGGRVPRQYKGFHQDEIREIFAKDESEFELVKMDQEGKPVPRIEWMERLAVYRVVGNDNDVIEAEIKAKSKADDRLDKYLRELRLRMPDTDEQARHREEQLARAEARKPAHQRQKKNEQAAA